LGAAILSNVITEQMTTMQESVHNYSEGSSFKK